MPKVNKRIARKDIYENGLEIVNLDTKTGKGIDRSKPANKDDKLIVKKGQEYYSWKLMYGKTQVSLTPPQPSQLTSSSFLQSFYSLRENVNISIDSITSREEVDELISSTVDELNSLKDELEINLENIPEQLRDANAGSILTERIEALDETIAEIDGIDISDLDSIDESDDEFLVIVKEKCEEVYEALSNSSI